MTAIKADVIVIAVASWAIMAVGARSGQRYVLAATAHWLWAGVRLIPAQEVAAPPAA